MNVVSSSRLTFILLESKSMLSFLQSQWEHLFSTFCVRRPGCRHAFMQPLI